jgi:hypothetical protein
LFTLELRGAELTEIKLRKDILVLVFGPDSLADVPVLHVLLVLGRMPLETAKVELEVHVVLLPRHDLGLVMAHLSHQVLVVILALLLVLLGRILNSVVPCLEAVFAVEAAVLERVNSFDVVSGCVVSCDGFANILPS